MGKVLIATFNDDEEIVFNELIFSLKKRSHAMLMNLDSSNRSLRYNSIVINPRNREVKVNDNNIKMTNYEFEILYLLARNPGQVFSKEQIYTQVWNAPYCGAEDNVMSLIRRIRKKIEPNPAKPIYILTVWGIGYKFNNAIKRK